MYIIISPAESDLGEKSDLEEPVAFTHSRFVFRKFHRNILIIYRASRQLAG